MLSATGVLCMQRAIWTGPKDSALAVQWYHRAAERGHSDAQYNLGFMYVIGEGVQRDHEEGLRWLRLAADQGEGPAMRLMADLYREGLHGVPLDPVQAADWDQQYRAYEERRVKITEEAT